MVLPFDFSSALEFDISIASINVTSVRSIMLDDAVDLSSCIRLKDRTITVTTNDTIFAGPHQFKMLLSFDGKLPESISTSDRIELIINDFSFKEEMQKCLLTYLRATIRNPLEEATLRQHETASNVSCECLCDLSKVPGVHNEGGCTGLCGLAHTSHDMWWLGVILYELSTGRSLWPKDNQDNINDATSFVKLCTWNEQFKEEKLQDIGDICTRWLASQLLQRNPEFRPRCIDEVLSIPFNESHAVLQYLSDLVTDRPLNISTRVLSFGKFSHAAYGLRYVLRVPDSWSEEASCTLQGLQDEVDLLKDCPDCAQVQHMSCTSSAAAKQPPRGSLHLPLPNSWISALQERHLLQLSPS